MQKAALSAKYIKPKIRHFTQYVSMSFFSIRVQYQR